MTNSIVSRRLVYFTLFIVAIGCGGSSSDPAVPTYVVGGSVSGLDGTLVLQNNGDDDLELTVNGDFELEAEVPEGTEYDITIEEQPDGQTCTIENGSGTVTDDDVEDIEITCEDDPTLTYSSLAFEEDVTNDGYLNPIIITLEGDTFANITTWTEGVEYTLTGTALPGGVTLVVTATDATTLDLGFIGYADEHRVDDNLSGTILTISPVAFTSGEAANNSVEELSFEFLNATTVVAYSAGLRNGNLGGRSGADALCDSLKPGNVYQNNVRAFIGVDAADEIRDFATLSGLSTTLPIVSATGNTVANNWADFVDDSVDATMQAAGVTSNGTNHWSGSFADGSITPIDTCSGWTDATVGETGSSGSSSATTEFLFQNNSETCNLTRHLLCIAYD